MVAERKRPDLRLVARGPSYIAQPGSPGLFVQGVTLRIVQSLLHLDRTPYPLAMSTKRE